LINTCDVDDVTNTDDVTKVSHTHTKKDIISWKTFSLIFFWIKPLKGDQCEICNKNPSFVLKYSSFQININFFPFLFNKNNNFLEEEKNICF